jgi:predicted dehydrogenase
MLFDVGSHLFDVAQFILGPIESVTGFIFNIPRQQLTKDLGTPTEVETDDIAAAWFSYENQVSGQWFISRVTPPFADNGYVEVIGRKGALKASLSRGRVDVLKYSHPSRPSWVDLPLPKEAYDKSPHCLGLMMRSFVDACLRGKLDGDIDASFYDGLIVQKGLKAVIEASQHRTWVCLEQMV